MVEVRDHPLCVEADAEEVAGSAAVEAQLRGFCERAARAKCVWAFDCVGSGQIHTQLGLSGPEIDDCAAADTEACLADATDRLDRETLDFADDAVGACEATRGGGSTTW